MRNPLTTKDLESVNLDRFDNVIVVDGNVHPVDLRFFCLLLHQTVTVRGFLDVVLDFSGCESITETVMLPLMPIITDYREKNVAFELKLPTSEGLARLFSNANWAHHISPDRYEQSMYAGGHVPALRFGSDDMSVSSEILDRVMNLILVQLETSREALKAMEWSLWEIMDNVSNHANSKVGGFIQATAYPSNNEVEFVVADAGIGIPESMKMKNHPQALRQAIDEGTTRDKSSNAGNGLYGSFRVATMSDGQFQINSLNGSLYCTADGRVSSRRNQIPYKGTSVRCRIGLSDSTLLDRALRFKGGPHDPAFDYIERKFENEVGDLIFDVRKEARHALGSRQGGQRIRSAIENLLRMHPKVTIDFQGVGVISSSFADEVFGRLFVEMGPRAFMTRLSLVNVDPTVEGLIDRAIVQRTRLGNGDT